MTGQQRGKLVKMKLFLVGSDKIYAIENFYVKYLRELGMDVFHFPAQSIFYDYYQQSMLNKLLFKTGQSRILKTVNQKFKEAVVKFDPDVIWIFKGMEIFPETLAWAKSRNIKLVNFNGDSPFIFSGKGSGNTYVTKSIPLYDLFLTYNLDDKHKIETVYNIRSEMLPFGFDLENKLYQDCVGFEEIQRVCFLGNPDSIRGDFLNSLARRGIKLDVYGQNWHNFVDKKMIKIYNPVYGDDLWRILRKYRVQLNLLRPHNTTTHNMRTFEAGGVGAIQLAPHTADHREYFKENEEIFLFENVDSCYEQILKIMNFTNSEAEKVRCKARARSLASGYTYKDRSGHAFEFIKSLNFSL